MLQLSSHNKDNRFVLTPPPLKLPCLSTSPYNALYKHIPHLIHLISKPNPKMCHLITQINLCCLSIHPHATSAPCPIPGTPLCLIQIPSYSRKHTSYALCPSCVQKSPTFGPSHLWDGWGGSFTSARRKEEREKLRNPPPPTDEEILEKERLRKWEKAWKKLDEVSADIKAWKEAQRNWRPKPKEYYEAMVESQALHPEWEAWLEINREQDRNAWYAIRREKREKRERGVILGEGIEPWQEREALVFSEESIEDLGPVEFEAKGRRYEVTWKEMVRRRPRPAGKWSCRVCYWDFDIYKDVAWAGNKSSAGEVSSINDTLRRIAGYTESAKRRFDCEAIISS